MKVKYVILLLSFLTVTCPVFGFSLKEKMAVFMVQKQYGKIMDIASDVYNNLSDNISSDEVSAIAFGGLCHLNAGDTLTARKYSQIVVPAYIEAHDKDEIVFQKLSIQERRNFLVDFAVEYAQFYALFLLADEELQKRYSSIHHRLAVKNRNILLSGTIEERSRIPLILQSDLLWLTLNNRMEMALLSHIPSLMELPKLCQNEKEKLVIAISIKPALDTYKQVIANMAFLQNSDTKEYLYADKVLNFLLASKELELYLSGNMESKDYHNVKWQNIQKVLKPSEEAVLLCKVSILGMDMTASLKFNSTCMMPEMSIIGIDMYKQPINDILTDSMHASQQKTIYLSIADNRINEDVVYTAQNIYLKYSLCDIYRHEKAKCRYSNGLIEMMADIKYGENCKLPPLHEGKYLINEVKRIFPNQVYALSGNNVKRINFFNIVGDIEVLHISTHGIVGTRDDDKLWDTISVFNRIMGKNELNSLYLCLSGYNGNPHENTLSANDIQYKVKIHDHGLVYLDACNTSFVNKLALMEDGSISKAFYVAGARNIIAYLGEINEKVATEFAILFYKKIASGNPDMTYHKAFYETKKEILERNRNSTYLSKDVYGRPKLDILLWE